MLKYVQIAKEETKLVNVNDNDEMTSEEAVSLGLSEEKQEVEQAYDGSWYLKGFAPAEPEKTYAEKRLAEYPSMSDQLDMLYWDKVNGTNVWQETIAEIKAKYPKE